MKLCHLFEKIFSSVNYLQTQKICDSKNKGFTLIEVMIAVGILAVVSAITIPNFNSFINDQNLRQAQESVKNGIRDAQNRALTGVSSTSACGGNTCNYWVFYYDSGDTNYRIGRIYSSSTPNASNCNSSSISQDVVSEILQGGAQFVSSGGGSCAFFRMITSDPVFVGLSSNTICIESGANRMRILMNDSGLVQGLAGGGAGCP